MKVNYTEPYPFRPIPTITVASDYWENKKWRFNVPEITVGTAPQPSWQDIILSGNTALTLTNALANGLNYLKLFGGTKQRNLPSEYTQVEYLESDGNQYIDTGYAPNVNTEVKINFSTTTLPSSDAYMFHSSDGGSARVSLAITQHLVFFGNNLNDSGNRVTLSSFTENTAYDMTVNKDKVIVNGTEYTFTHTSVTLPTMGSIGLFGTKTGNLKCQGRIKSFSCNENNVLRINLIPCKRNSDNVLGMYDTVTGNFLTNSGTGSFTAGADVVPSPTTPMDIVSNNGVIKVNLNLYSTEYYDSTLSQTNGVTVTTNTGTRGVNVSSMIDCRTIKSFMITIANPAGSYRLFKYNSSKSFIDANTTGNIGDALTLDSTVGYFRIQYNYTSINTQNILIYNSAYSLNGIYTDGTTETVEITGKNLFDETWEQGAISGTPNRTYEECKTALTTRIRIVNEIYLDPTKTYTISINNPDLEFVIQVFNEQHKLYVIPNITNVWVASPKTFTGAYGVAVALRYKNPADILPSEGQNAKVQLELGSTATTYEPYFNGGTATAENLFKVGTYQDVQSVIDGGVIHRCGIKVLNGSEDWTQISGANYVSLLKATINMIGDSNATCLMTSLNQVLHADINTSINCFSVGASYLNCKLNGYTSVTDFKQYLASQYNSGNPVIVVYPLATATTETVTGQPLTIQEGTNIVEITQASMDNLELEVKYKAGVAVTITEVENAQLDNNVEVTING